MYTSSSAPAHLARRLFAVGFMLFSLCLPASPAQAQAAWRASVDLRIGGAEDDENAFTRVAALLVSPAGEIYVGDGEERAIRVFSASGRRLRKIGRRGGGPGEFEALTSMGWRGDTLFVSDERQRRITLFSAAGRVAGTRRVEATLPGPPPAPVAPVALLANGTTLGLLAPSPTALATGAIPRLPLVRVDGARAVPLAFLDWRDNKVALIALDGGQAFFSRPVSGESLWAVAPSGDALYVVDRPVPRGAGTSSFRVTRLRPNGDTVYTRTYEHRPVPLTRAQRDSLTGAVTRALRRAQPGDEAVRRAMRLPEYQPPVTKVVAGRDGTVWLRREGIGRQAVEWTVLDASGRILASLRLPAGLQVYQADRGHVWGVMPDEMDVPQILRYRITPA